MKIIRHGQNRLVVITNPRPDPPKGWREHIPAARARARAEDAGLLYWMTGTPLPPTSDDSAFQFALEEERNKIRQLRH